MAYDIKGLETLIRLAKKHKLAELSVEDGKSKVQFKFRGAQPAQMIDAQSVAFAQSKAAESPSVNAAVESAATESRYHKVLSPFVGTFYRAPSPESESYVQEGQMVRKGDPLCIVEAMKLMNEIESEVSGKIVSILAQNAQAVEYGEPLFLIDPL